MEVASLTQKSNGFYFSEEVGFEPEIKKSNKKSKGDKKDGKEKGNKEKSKN